VILSRFMRFPLLHFALMLLALAVALPANAQFNGPAISTTGALNQPAPITSDPSLLHPNPRDPVLVQGDTIAIRVFEQTDYTPTVTIGTDGKVMLPLLGVISLDHLTVTAAEDLIADRLRGAGIYKDPQVTIQVTEGPSASATVIGESHGLVPIVGSRRLLDVLSATGGLPGSASHVITINRAGLAEPIVVDLGTDPSQSSAANIPIFAGDTIVVARVGTIYLLGSFKTQGVVPLSSNTPLTLMQAAALGGGIAFEAKLSDLRLIRTIGNQRTVVKLNMKKVMYGKAPDPILQPNDILFLPDSVIKSSVSNGTLGTLFGVVSVLFSTLAYAHQY
jgi:polysaccharide export outer membrane protein